MATPTKHDREEADGRVLRGARNRARIPEAIYVLAKKGAFLAPELRGTPRALLEALDMLASFEVWDGLRGEQSLEQQKAARAVETSIRAMLASHRRTSRA